MILGREENKLETVTENMENRTVPFSLFWGSWRIKLYKIYMPAKGDIL